MGTPFIGEVKVVSFNFPPRGWAACNGQQLPIAQNQPLFSLLGTQYGGNGQTTFALPNLQGRVPLHRGSVFSQGSASGENSHVLLQGEMPSHTHQVSATTAASGSDNPISNLLSASSFPLYTTQIANTTTLNPATVGNAGGNQPHENRQPFLPLYFIISLTGIYPSRN